MGTSRKTGDQILGMISKRRAERLLIDLVSMPPGFARKIPGGIERMLSIYPDVFKDFLDCGTAPDPGKDTESERNLRRFKRDHFVMLLVQVRDGLQRAWDTPDIRN